MANLASALTIILAVTFVAYYMVKNEIDKVRIFRDYDVLIWDEQDYHYVVKDKETGKQYELDSSLRGYKFKEATLDWSDIKYIKERIPGTHRYDTTLPSKKCVQ